MQRKGPFSNFETSLIFLRKKKLRIVCGLKEVLLELFLTLLKYSLPLQLSPQYGRKLSQDVYHQPLSAMFGSRFGKHIGQMNNLLPGEYDIQRWVQAHCLNSAAKQNTMSI